MSESQFQTKVLSKLRKKYPGYWRKISDKFRSGILDIIGCFESRFVSFELKIPKEGVKAKPTPLQQHEIEEIINAGGKAICCNTFEEIEECMEQLKKEIKNG